ncbi:hypothetical protein KSB_59710 [Ktedonobacter robiniae]|uniref:Uncharacterized protein n=1 Tax=Ktedonobacter robiniae TaxID=2778365 RepID=A0ABQ3UXS2_9CHLR|nr:hypothetical protein KSB_59710 [Ktedonobacter robiniae]
MDPISTFILTQIADTIIGTLTNDGTQEMISKLQGDPTKRALKKALGTALTLYVMSQPERKKAVQEEEVLYRQYILLPGKPPRP